ncbi:nitrate reductase molybdenum cofactor assembly chaperone [Streptomyces sp. NPDC091272]|uniref:nitrate reductase molybdenum cofactor assembly chaperone n=1 Tax=Streptomyces sp. NPDC091272 TaxID=3365981 RepID=UPI0038226600
MSRDDGRETALLHQAAARCLVYPDETRRADLPMLDAALAPLRVPAATLLRDFVAHAAATPPQELAAHYVQVFDFKNRRCLYLSWWADGDTRRRGMSLVRFKQVYRAHGLEFTDEELPDYLPAVLEFAAATGHLELLHEHRPGLELLRLALTEADTPYVKLLEAVCATLPGPSPRDRAAAMAMIRNGPPREDVGLEPYGQFDLLPVLTGEPS